MGESSVSVTGVLTCPKSHSIVKSESVTALDAKSVKALAALQPLEQVTTAEVSLGPEKLLFQLPALEVSAQRLALLSCVCHKQG